jgi:N-acetylated-alpha-linked acidic dipeptidase
LITVRSFLASLVILSTTQFTFAQSAEPVPLAGYSRQTSANERSWEKKLQDGVVASNLRENMQRLSARPHHVGSPYDKDNSEWLLAKFKEYGFDAISKPSRFFSLRPKSAWSNC